MQLMKVCRTITVCLLALLTVSAWAGTDANSLYQQAQARFADQHYQAAVELMQKAVKLEPDNSDFQHLLGKCYGRLAEQSNPISAISLSQKTRKALEKAVQLDNHNISALRDLMEYYRQAPGFLGGSKTKANKIEKRLQDFGVSTG